ncbi:MAG: ABC transporter ATP-binding protein [Gammaproteobacteria bacterium]
MTEKNNVPVIELVNVSKVYHTYPTPRHRLLEIFSGGRKNYSNETRALDNISYTLEKGGRLGIVGENGSGKSTLLKALAGVLTPTSGAVKVRGRVSALLELGAGFNPELPGHENISQFCMLHGMHRDEIEQALPEIVKFSELREAIDHPVKTYSSGMTVRLGFSCAVHVQPDILIVDEALSVGDAYFQNKCLHKIRSMLDKGTSFIYVTHAADAIRSLCNEGIWLEKGKIRLSGKSADVGAAYQTEVFSRMVRAGFEVDTSTQDIEQIDPDDIETVRTTDRSRQKAFAERVESLRTGSGEARIIDIELIDSDDNEADSLPFESNAHVRVYFNTMRALNGNVAITLGVFEKNGIQIMHFNSLVHGIDASRLALKKNYVIDFKFKCPLTPGEYGLAAGITSMKKSPTSNAQMNIDSVIDHCAGGARFAVKQPDGTETRDLWGICYVDCDADLTQIS